MTNLTSKIFTDEEAARAHFEAIRWPSGKPACPHCGVDGEATLINGKSHRPGMYMCNACREPFTVTVGTVMEKSHIPLNKWALAFHLMAASKKGVSAHQLHRTLGITYKSAWFLAHRIREAMAPLTNEPPMGGKGKTVEADETYFGKRKGVKKVGQGGHHRSMMPIVGLVQRGGTARTFFVETANKRTVLGIVKDNVAPETTLHTDESHYYKGAKKIVAKHETVTHSKDEYVRGDVTTNAVEGYFSIFKRGMVGTYQHCGEQHLQRYLNEFDFRMNNRIKLGVDDTERTSRAIKGAEGKRLTYRQADRRPEAS